MNSHPGLISAVYAALGHESAGSIREAQTILPVTPHFGAPKIDRNHRADPGSALGSTGYVQTVRGDTRESFWPDFQTGPTELAVNREPGGVQEGPSTTELWVRLKCSFLKFWRWQSRKVSSLCPSLIQHARINQPYSVACDTHNKIVAKLISATDWWSINIY